MRFDPDGRPRVVGLRGADGHVGLVPVRCSVRSPRRRGQRKVSAGWSVLGSGDRHLGAAGTGVARHDPGGEEAATMWVILSGTGPPGGLLRAVRDGAVTMHNQLSETALHPPHLPFLDWILRPRREPSVALPFPTPGEVSGRSIGATWGLLEEFRNAPPISSLATSRVVTGSRVTPGGQWAPGPVGRSSPPPRSRHRPPARDGL